MRHVVVWCRASCRSRWVMQALALVVLDLAAVLERQRFEARRVEAAAREDQHADFSGLSVDAPSPGHDRGDDGVDVLLRC